MAKANPLRFSTKYQDDETDLLYYAFRYYSPSTGRWLSRDPLWEKASRNLNCFVGNDPVAHLDPLGREIFPRGVPPPAACFCICGQPTFKFNPGGSSFQWGWITGPGVGKHGYRFGNDITTTWHVTGYSRLCHYYHEESGYVIFTRLRPPKVPDPLNGTGAPIEISDPPTLEARHRAVDLGITLPQPIFTTETMTYTDGFGGGFFQPPADDGHWIIDADYHITYTCVSSDGTRSTSTIDITGTETDFPPHSSQ